METANRDDIVIRTVDLCKTYGTLKAVDHLNLEIRRGEIFGLLGPNGAGKTTTTLMLLGLTDPTSGEAYIEGRNCTRDSLAVKKEVGYLPDNVGFYPNMSGRDNLVFSGEMNGLTKQQAEEKAKQVLERVGMTAAADRDTGTYSRGMRQRLGVADVLMKDPKLIIMDEPTGGLDPQATTDLISMIHDLSKVEGITILISSHDLYQIQKISDRVGIFVSGHMIACGRIEELGKQLQNEGLYMFDVMADRRGDSTWDKDLLNDVRELPNVKLIGRKVDGTIHVESSSDVQQQLEATLLRHDYTVREMHRQGGDLDEIYRKYFERAEAEQEGGNSNGRGKAEPAHGAKRTGADERPSKFKRGISRILGK